VRRWVTFNEPFVMAVWGPKMQPGSDVWRIAHSTILAHAGAVQAYATHFQPTQKGSISIVLNASFFEPFDASSTADQEAATRRMVFYVGWFADPIFLGRDYPREMRDLVGDRLPIFSSDELLLLSATAPICRAAFFGLNENSSNNTQ
jgi:beta-glucosidase